MAKVQSKSETTKSFGLKLLKRNKFKWFGYHLTGMLYYQNPDSELAKSYRNSFYCCNSIEVDANGLAISLWCKNRWCPLCQRNKMGAMINAYYDRLQMEKEMYFVTLSRRNVGAADLKAELDRLQALWHTIATSRRYRRAIKEGVIGIRKLECTYHGTQTLKDGRPDPWYDTFHPHFHILISSRELAKWMVEEWLRLSPDSSDRQSQDCKKVNSDGSYLEIFKYFTKLIAKDSSGRRYFDALHMNTIFEAMQHRRVYFRLGTGKSWGVAEVNEEDIEQAAVLDTDASSGVYKWEEFEKVFGYYEVDSGEVLTELPKSGSLYDMVTDSEQRIGVPAFQSP